MRRIPTKPIKGHEKYGWALCPFTAECTLFYGHYRSSSFLLILLLTYAVTLWIPPQIPYNPDNPGVRPSKAGNVGFYVLGVLLGLIGGFLMRETAYT